MEHKLVISIGGLMRAAGIQPYGRANQTMCWKQQQAIKLSFSVCSIPGKNGHAEESGFKCQKQINPNN